MGLFGSVYKAFSRKDDDIAKLKSGNTEFGRHLHKPIPQKELESVTFDGPKSPAMKFKRLRGKISPRVHKTPTTIDLLKKRQSATSPRNVAMPEPTKNTGRTLSIKESMMESQDSLATGLSGFSDRALNTLTIPSDDARNHQPNLSPTYSLASTLSLFNKGDLLHHKTVSKKLQDAFTDSNDHNTQEKGQMQPQEEEAEKTFDNTEESFQQRGIIGETLQFALKMEEQLHHLLSVREKPPNVIIRRINEEGNSESKTTVNLSPKLSKRRQEELLGLSKRYKPTGTQSMTNHQHQSLTGQFDNEVESGYLSNKKLADEKEPTVKMEAHSPTAVEMLQPPKHQENRQSETNDQNNTCNLLELQKKSNNTPEFIDLSIFDLDEDNDPNTAKDVEQQAKPKSKRKLTMAQKIKRLNKARRAAKDASALQDAKEKNLKTNGVKRKPGSKGIGSATSQTSNEALQAKTSNDVLISNNSNGLQKARTPKDPINQPITNSVCEKDRTEEDLLASSENLDQLSGSIDRQNDNLLQDLLLITDQKKQIPAHLSTQPPENSADASRFNVAEQKEQGLENGRSAIERGQGLTSSARLGLFLGMPENAHNSEINKQFKGHVSSDIGSDEPDQSALLKIRQQQIVEAHDTVADKTKCTSQGSKERTKVLPETNNVSVTEHPIDNHSLSDKEQDRLSHKEEDEMLEDYDLDKINDMSRKFHQDNPTSQKRTDEDIIEPISTNPASAEADINSFKSFFVLESPRKALRRTADSDDIETSTQGVALGRNIVTGTHSTHNYGLQFDERLFREHLDEIQKQASRLDDMVRENPTNDQQDLQEKPEASTSTQVEHLNKEGGSILPPSNETPASLTHRIVENSRPNEVNSKVYKGNGVRKRGDLESRRRKRVSRVRNMFRLTNSSSEEDFSPDEDATVLKRVYTHHKSRNVAVRRFKNAPSKASHEDHSQVEEFNAGDTREDHSQIKERNSCGTNKDHEQIEGRNTTDTHASLVVSKDIHQLAPSQGIFATSPNFTKASRQKVVSGTDAVDKLEASGSSNERRLLESTATVVDKVAKRATIAELLNAEDEPPFSKKSDLDYVDNIGDANVAEVKRTVSQVYFSNVSAEHNNNQPQQQSSIQLIRSPTEKSSGVFGSFVKPLPKGNASSVEAGDGNKADDSFDMSTIASSIEDVAGKRQKSSRKKKRLKANEGRTSVVDKRTPDPTSEKILSDTNKQDTTIEVYSQAREGLDAITKVESDIAKEMLNDLSKKKVDNSTNVQPLQSADVPKKKKNKNKANESRKRKNRRKKMQVNGV